MGIVFAASSVSLDGFSAGPNVGLEFPMGEGGLRLHRWMFDGKTERDEQIANSRFQSAGAVVIGRRTFDVGIGVWGEDGTFRMPCFVLTHHAREPLEKGPTTFHFVSQGLEAAIELAKAAAGTKNVWLLGGATTLQQAIAAGLVDEIQVNLVPVLLGKGTRLFGELDRTIELDRREIIETPHATHLQFRLVK